MSAYGSLPASACPKPVVVAGKMLHPQSGVAYEVVGQNTGKTLWRIGQRSRFSITGSLISILFPWVLHSSLLYAYSFSLHYKRPGLTHFLGFCGLVIVCGATGLALGRAGLSKASRWSKAAALSTFLAWFLGVSVGQINFVVNMEKYYDFKNLNSYPGIDVARVPGQQVMDAGIVSFGSGHFLDLTKATGFKSSKTYCVVPIAVGDTQLATYDFWAVGVDCCSGAYQDFRCGEYNNPRASSGLRILDEKLSTFFRLGVQQAEAEFGIGSSHPVFFEWSQDPVGQVNTYEDRGVKTFLLCTLTFFAFQAFLVTVEVVALSKMDGQ